MPWADASGNPIRSTGAPAFMQNSSGGYELITYDEGVYHYRREWNGVQWRAVQDLLPLERPIGANTTSIGLVELDGQPRDLRTLFSQNPWPYEASRPYLARLQADETWHADPPILVAARADALP